MDPAGKDPSHPCIRDQVGVAKCCYFVQKHEYHHTNPTQCVVMPLVHQHGRHGRGHHPAPPRHASLSRVLHPPATTPPPPLAPPQASHPPPSTSASASRGAVRLGRPGAPRPPPLRRPSRQHPCRHGLASGLADGVPARRHTLPVAAAGHARALSSVVSKTRLASHDSVSALVRMLIGEGKGTLVSWLP
jgi:hypothetical protein